jgi:Holliday junction resolvase RusA-like endonuclease
MIISASGARSTGSSDAGRWRGWEARSQYRGEPLIGPLDVDVTVYWPDRREHDHDNMKVLWDALNGIVWQDDGQITDSHVHKRFDKGNPRVEMIVKAGEIR